MVNKPKLIINSEWPKATDLLYKTQEDKKYHGQAIIELLIEEINGKFLDIRCGEGYATAYASKYAKIAVGYDIQEYNWEVHSQNNQFILTTNYNDVVAHFPYQVILAFDILDHCKNQKQFLQKIYKILDKKGLLYLRTHPWQSRHATHDHRNLAYIHLYQESYQESNGIYHAKKETYNLLGECGFSIIKKREIHEEIEPFFNDKISIEKPQTLQYIDYILEKSKVITL